jgi:hypothetical protein
MPYNLVDMYQHTEQAVSRSDTSDFYSEGDRVESRLGQRLSGIKFSVVFLSHSVQMPE